MCLIEQGSLINFGILEQTQQNFSLNEVIKNTIEGLGPQHPFLIFDINFSDKEKTCLADLHINLTTEYNNYGNTEGLNKEVVSFIESLGNHSKTSACISQLITRVVKEVIVGSGKEAAWIALRALTETKEFDLPRWHTDGHFYLSNLDSIQYKIIITPGF